MKKVEADMIIDRMKDISFYYPSVEFIRRVTGYVYSLVDEEPDAEIAERLYLQFLDELFHTDNETSFSLHDSRFFPDWLRMLN